MADRIKITCEKCSCEIEHICNPDLKESFVQLFEWVPDVFKNKDESFLNSDRLYKMLGKDDWRTLSAMLGHIARQAGLDAHALRTEALKNLEAKKAQRIADEARRKARRAAALTKSKE